MRALGRRPISTGPQSGPTFLSSLRRFVALPLLVLLTACDTLKQDFDALGETLTPVSPQEAARWMVDPHDPDNRRKGTVLIANSPFGGADPYLAIYRDRVRYESDPLVKAAALTALGRYGRPPDAPPIAECLSDENVQVRRAAAAALQRIHNPAVVPDLLFVLHHAEDDDDARVATAIALGQYPQDRVFQGLVAALEIRQLAINEAARKSLQTLTGQDFGLEPEAWLKWYNEVDDPFAGQEEFLYPTYQRKESFLEKLAFWSSPTWETPAPPTGLEAPKRRTYSDSDEPADETGG